MFFVKHQADVIRKHKKITENLDYIKNKEMHVRSLHLTPCPPPPPPPVYTRNSHQKLKYRKSTSILECNHNFPDLSVMEVLKHYM